MIASLYRYTRPRLQVATGAVPIPVRSRPCRRTRRILLRMLQVVYGNARLLQMEVRRGFFPTARHMAAAMTRWFARRQVRRYCAGPEGWSGGPRRKGARVVHRRYDFVGVRDDIVLKDRATHSLFVVRHELQHEIQVCGRGGVAHYILRRKRMRCYRLELEANVAGRDLLAALGRLRWWHLKGRGAWLRALAWVASATPWEWLGCLVVIICACMAATWNWDANMFTVAGRIAVMIAIGSSVGVLAR